MKNKILLFVTLILVNAFAVNAQVSTLNELFSEYKSTYDIELVEFSAIQDGHFLYITYSIPYIEKVIRLDLNTTEMTVQNSEASGSKYEFVFRDLNGIEVIQNNSKLLYDNWSFKCDSEALKNRTEYALCKIFEKSTADYYTSSPEYKIYSDKHFSIKYPSSWESYYDDEIFDEGEVVLGHKNPDTEEYDKLILIGKTKEIDWSEISEFKDAIIPMVKYILKKAEAPIFFISEPSFIRLAKLPGIHTTFMIEEDELNAKCQLYLVHEEDDFTYLIISFEDVATLSYGDDEVRRVLNSIHFKQRETEI